MPSLQKVSTNNQLFNKKQHNMSGAIGATAGILVSAVFQPLEILKIALIMAPQKKSTLVQKFKDVYRDTIANNGWRGFWKGLTPAIIKNSLGSSLYFFILKNIQKKEGSEVKSNAFLNSASARIMSCILINPFTVLQTRFLMPGIRIYQNIFKAIYQIYSKQGSKAFFKGSIPVCYKQGIFAGIYYQLYVKVKSKKDQFNLLDSFGSGLFAGSVATIISHPFQIVRARMQCGLSYDYFGLTQAFKKIYTQEGIHGYMRGIGPRLARKPLINSATFLIYEAIERKINQHFNLY